MPENYRVEMNNITKSFTGVHALKDVSISVKPGEIHALIGENGAGKSTLMKILSGAYQKDTGKIKIDGKPVEILNPHMGRELGIGIIYQEFALAPDMSVAENIFIGRLGNKIGLINWTGLYKKTDELIKSIGFTINPRTLVGDLSVAYQQVVEITKALSENVKILILDEPTAVLAPREVEHLFEVLKKLKAQGVSIIYISHRLDEIFLISDQITVLKDGCVMNTVNPKDVSNDSIINMMIGRKLTAMFPKRESKIGEEVFKVEELNSGKKVRNVSFSVRAGEVFGIAGLVGSGRTELARAIFGADRKDSGKITLNNKLLKIKSPVDSVKYGIGLIPENRKEQGVILSMSIRENLTMPSIKKISGIFGVINKRYERKFAQSLIEKLAIKTKNMDSEVAELSGGNQQKVVLAKWFGNDCKFIILDEPTRGIDIGTKVEIYTLINELASTGIATIVISSEMLEIIGICDRVMIMSEGEASGIIKKEDLSEESIMRLSIAKRRN